jgi:hypothetical protein
MLPLIKSLAFEGKAKGQLFKILIKIEYDEFI